jgi:hypothetical protein
MTWSAALSAMTTVAGLDGLTFLPWAAVVSQNGLSMHGRGQFCPSCFAEDKATGRTPYFRLAWESNLVTVCPQHKVQLTTFCAHCGRQDVRHGAAFVVPGWCTRCGGFLGETQRGSDDVGTMESSSLWQASQVGDLLAAQFKLTAPPTRAALLQAVEHIISLMDGGQPAAFARRVGIGKSTVHHWLKKGTPTLGMSLGIAAQSGISLTRLLTGNVSGWSAPAASQQMNLKLLMPERQERVLARRRDWGEVERQLEAFLVLPTPIPVLDAARRLDVEARQLYLNANTVTRKLGERWVTYLRRRREASVEGAMPYLDAACRELIAEGRAVTKRAVVAKVPAEVLRVVPHLFDVLKDVQAQLIEVKAIRESANADDIGSEVVK